LNVLVFGVWRSWTVERRGFPARGRSGGAGVRDERGVWLLSTSEVRRQLGQIMSWEKPVAGMEDVKAIL